MFIPRGTAAVLQDLCTFRGVLPGDGQHVCAVAMLGGTECFTYTTVPILFVIHLTSI